MWLRGFKQPEMMENDAYYILRAGQTDGKRIERE
jgi:hypothetical protein